MATTSTQKRIEGRVMHEFKHGELKSGPDGEGGKVKSRKQAIAIALSEAGASRFKSGKSNEKARAGARAKEAKGETAQQEREGRDHVGADDKRESTKAMGGKDAKAKTKRGARAAQSRARQPDGYTVLQLRGMAARKGVARRSRLTKQQLKNALGIA